MVKSSKYFLVLIMLNMIQHHQFAQTKKIDSLKKVLLTAKEDTVKIILGNKISWNLYLTSNYDSSVAYAQRALQLAEKTNFPAEKAKAHNNLGVCYIDKGNYPQALKEFQTALVIFKKTGVRKGIANTYNNIGIVYKEQGNYPEALKEYFSALKIREALNDKQG